MLCEVERKNCHLDPLTRPSLMPDVISHREKNFCSGSFFYKFFTHINFLTEYPPPYHHLIWDYSNAGILNIRKYIGSINWNHLFSDSHIDIVVSEECFKHL